MTDSSSLTAASAIPTIVSASRRISSRSASESSELLSSLSWCSLRWRMKSLMPIAADYSGTGLARVAVPRRLDGGDEPRARGHGEEHGGDPDDDRHEREPPRAEEKTDDA